MKLSWDNLEDRNAIIESGEIMKYVHKSWQIRISNTSWLRWNRLINYIFGYWNNPRKKWFGGKIFNRNIF
mgnify:CR=1 FL=1